MIRIVTIVGEVEFEEADAYSVSPPNLPPSTVNYASPQIVYPTQTLPGSLKLWKLDPDGDEDKAKLLAWFSPNGWIAIDFRESEPVTQLPPLGFRATKDEEQGEWVPDEKAHVPRSSSPPRGTPVPTPKTTPVPTPKTTPVVR